MKLRLSSLKIVFSAVLACTLIGCTTYEKDPREVVIHELSDNDMLNPMNYRSAGSGYIIKQIFQQLLNVDFNTLEIIPVLAKDRPKVEERENGGLLITYEIRDEAVWDNGEPITAKDVEFSLKIIKCPKVDCPRIRPYYEFIEDFQTYEDNPKKLTFVCKEKYILAESASGDYAIVPSHVYDPEGLMEEFTVKQLSENAAELATNEKIIKFAEGFNSEKHQREAGYIVGSGAYEFDEWITGQRVVLKRKESWWGDKLTGTNIYFKARPPKIIYQTINDQTTALVALKAGNIDIMRSIKSKDFVDLVESEKFKENFVAHTPMSLSYTYLGMNTKRPKFADVRVRKAFAHLIDVDKLIETLAYGMAFRIIGPLHPSNVKNYNFEIQPYMYDVEKSKELLAEAGWKDSNGNGILDKEIDGELTEFKVTYTYNSGNDTRKAVGLILQEEARKVGIQISVIPQEWTIYIENQKNHDFDIFFGAWIAAPVQNDPKQIWHTDSYFGGSNYTGFGNAKTDALIDSIRSTLDEELRSTFYKRFQKILHEEVPYIFMYTPSERIAIHKRFVSAESSVMRPGYWEAGFVYQERQ